MLLNFRLLRSREVCEVQCNVAHISANIYFLFFTKVLIEIIEIIGIIEIIEIIEINEINEIIEINYWN